MGLSASDFKDIISDGFGQRYEDSDEGESELRCFTCGKKAQLDEGFFSDKVICDDNHEQELKEFLVEHTAMRDGITDRSLKMMCSFDNVLMED